jgi:competence protein ComFC
MFVARTFRRPAYRLYQLAWAGLDWLYPHHCGGCDQPGARWCATCQSNLKQVTGSFCQICGQPEKISSLHPKLGVCPVCEKTPPPYIALRSWAIYNGSIRKAIHHLKYQGDMALGETLACFLVEKLQSLNWPVDMIVPVPISRMRRRKRGYNQAALLALPLAMGCEIGYSSRALIKVCETPSQVGLNPVERKENVASAFIAVKELVLGKNVLVVDDVATTGATLEACSRVLLDAAAHSVYCLTLARATPE